MAIIKVFLGSCSSWSTSLARRLSAEWPSVKIFKFLLLLLIQLLIFTALVKVWIIQLRIIHACVLLCWKRILLKSSNWTIRFFELLSNNLFSWIRSSAWSIWVYISFCTQVERIEFFGSEELLTGKWSLISWTPYSLIRWLLFQCGLRRRDRHRLPFRIHIVLKGKASLLVLLHIIHGATTHGWLWRRGWDRTVWWVRQRLLDQRATVVNWVIHSTHF